jgi:hypothetical protein
MTASNIYQDAAKKIYKILDVLERERRARYKLEPIKEKVDKITGSLPKNQKFYLLNKLFGLDPDVIARLEENKITASKVSQMIIRVSDKLRCGEICLFEVTPKRPRPLKNALM